MQEIFSFIIYSDLGTFRKPDVNTPARGVHQYLTFEFLPKPSLLGILGAFLGLKGGSREREPEYLLSLGGLKTGIQPLNLNSPEDLPSSPKSFSPRKGPLQKTFVEFTNLHGYGSEEKEGTLIVKEQILIRPCYRIFISRGKIEEEKYMSIQEKIEENVSEFTPYMGKNEFLLTVIPEGIQKAENIGEEGTKIETKIDSIFFKEILKKGEPQAGPPEEEEIFFYVYENYPYIIEGSHYRYEEAIWSNREFIVNKETLQNGDYKLMRIMDGRTVFLF